MIESTKEKPIEGLKIKYKDKTYENIMYLSISNWNGKNEVSFTSAETKNTTINVHCEFKDIEIIKE